LLDKVLDFKSLIELHKLVSQLSLINLNSVKQLNYAKVSRANNVLESTDDQLIGVNLQTDHDKKPFYEEVINELMQ
jgi:hypothetical protein